MLANMVLRFLIFGITLVTVFWSLAIFCWVLILECCCLCNTEAGDSEAGEHDFDMDSNNVTDVDVEAEESEFDTANNNGDGGTGEEQVRSQVAQTQVLRGTVKWQRLNSAQLFLPSTQEEC